MALGPLTAELAAKQFPGPPVVRLGCRQGIYLPVVPVPVADRNVATTSAGTRPRSLTSSPFGSWPSTKNSPATT